MRPIGWIVLVALGLGAVSILTLAGRPGSDYRHADFFQFWAAPRLLVEGGDPYDPADWAGIHAREAPARAATHEASRRWPYPLWTAALLLPLAALPFETAAAVWVVAQLSAVALALHLLGKVFALARPERVLLFGLALAFQPLWIIVGGGNITGFLFAAFVAALAAIAQGPFTAGTALGLTALKPHLFVVSVPALLAAARPTDRVRLVVGGAASVGALFVTTLPFGPEWIGPWIGAAFERQTVPVGSNSTVWTIGRVLPGAPWIAPLLAVASLVALVAWWRRANAPAHVLVAGAVPISLFVAPHGWSYDQVILLVTLAAILAEFGLMSGAHRTLGLVSAAVLVAPLPWALYALAFVLLGEEWSGVTPLAFFGLLVLTRSWSGSAAGIARVLGRAAT